MNHDNKAKCLCGLCKIGILYASMSFSSTCVIAQDPMSEEGAEHPLVAAQSQFTLEQLKTKLRSDPGVNAVLERFENSGGKFLVGDMPPSGAGYDPVSNNIGVDPARLGGLDYAVMAVVYELVRAEHSEKHNDLDQKALAGNVTREQYAKEGELLSYELLKEHSELMKNAVSKSGWATSADVSSATIAPGGAFDTFERYFAYANEEHDGQPSHTSILRARYDFVMKSSRRPPVEASPTVGPP